MANWIIDQIKQLYSFGSLITFTGGWLAKTLFEWWRQDHLQNKQAEMNTKLEELKIKGQQDVLAHQIKVSSLYTAYPELYTAFKKTESLVSQAFEHPQYAQEADESWQALSRKLDEQLVLLDKDFVIRCAKAKDKLRAVLDLHAQSNEVMKRAALRDMHQALDALGDEMRTRLGN